MLSFKIAKCFKKYIYLNNGYHFKSVNCISFWTSI